MDHPLVGGQVQRVAVARLGGREVALLKIRVPPRAGFASPGENVHVVIAAGMGVGVVDADGRTRLRDVMHGATSSTHAQWQARLEGAGVASVGESSLTFEREGRCWRAGAEGMGALALTEQAATDGDGTAMGLEHHAASGADVPSAPPPLGQRLREALAERGGRIVEELVRMDVGARREALRGALVKAIARLDRRIAAVRGDLARVQSADAAAERAQLFVAQAAQARRGATRLEAVDWSGGEARRIEMAIDPARGPKEQIDALFKRARRLKEGAKIASARLADGIKTRAAVAAVAEALAAQDVDLAALETQARTAAPRDFRLASGGAPSRHSGANDGARRPQCRTFLGASGARILVGRGAADNDTLTFRIARPHHLWLHAKSHAGAHVIVPLDKGQSCPADLLVEAAHLAAHFSDARDERVVEVQYTPRRYLRKPRGSVPGLVVVDREKVIVLRRKEGVLRMLLERELAG